MTVMITKSRPATKGIFFSLEFNTFYWSQISIAYRLFLYFSQSNDRRRHESKDRDAQQQSRDESKRHKDESTQRKHSGDSRDERRRRTSKSRLDTKVSTVADASNGQTSGAERKLIRSGSKTKAVDGRKRTRSLSSSSSSSSNSNSSDSSSDSEDRKRKKKRKHKKQKKSKKSSKKKKKSKK